MTLLIRTLAAALIVGQTMATAALADRAATLTAECHKQLNLGQRGCDCIGKRAKEVLNDKQQAMVVAMVTKDQQASAELRATMTQEEMSAAAGFMMNAPRLCAGQ